MSKYKLRIRPDQIDKCKRCEADATPEIKNFKGRLNQDDWSKCSHFSTDSGWWLRIDHKRNSVFGDPDYDVVGELMCPTCEKEHSKLVKELMGLD